MADWVFSIVDRLGAVGVGLLILLENLIPPIPSEVILPLAGYRARVGAMHILAIWPAATAGAVIGALMLYGLGAWLGYDRLHRLAAHRWFIFTSQRDLERGYDLFERHGGKVVLLARCVPFIRSVVSIPAGIAAMPLLRFTLLTAIGSGVWNAIFLALGWFLGENWALVEGWLQPASYVVVGLVAIGLVLLVMRRLRNRSRARADGAEMPEPDTAVTAPIPRVGGHQHPPAHAAVRPGPNDAGPGAGRPVPPVAGPPPGYRPPQPGGPHAPGGPGQAPHGRPGHPPGRRSPNADHSERATPRTARISPSPDDETPR